uniref:Uncharacterized protein n=1 Tax=Lygus hesperus TaxID=30085 RepID=A0A146LMJ5_LYGHE
MKLFVLLFSVVPLVLVYAEIYQPCDLAKFLYDNLEEHGTGVLNEIPLLVCVAGYHKFDTEYKAGRYTIAHRRVEEWNQTVDVLLYDYKGLFGLSKRDYIRLDNGNSTVPHEALFFLKHVVHFNHSRVPLHPNYAFFRNLCSGEYVKFRSCMLNDYMRFGFEIPVPLHHDINDFVPQPVKEPEPSTEKSGARAPAPVVSYVNCNCSEESEGVLGMFHQTIGYIVESSIFWGIGAIFYALRPRCFEGIV